MAAPVSPSYANQSLAMDLRVKLSIMMFLQYFAWGCWFVTMSTYIGENTGDKGAGIFADGFTGPAYATAAIAAMIAPFFLGTIADRFFSTERVLCVLHLAGAGVLYYLSTIDDQAKFYSTLVLHFLCYMPTLALTNSISMHHLPDPGRQFPGIRVLGTIGWIAAGLLIGALGISKTQLPMQYGAAALAVLGVYCLFLPHTPPRAKSDPISLGSILGLDALQLMRRWPFAVFVVCSFLVAIPLQFYYNYTNFYLETSGVKNPTGTMTIGQMSEIFFMLIMPFFFARLGVKKMLLIGMAAWAIRYVLFAYGNATDGMWMFYIAIFLHGICYDFFFVTGQIYVDNEADVKIRGAAQGFIAFATLGVGGFIGGLLSGQAELLAKSSGTMDWKQFWLMPAAGAAAVLVLFALTFFDNKPSPGRR